MDVEAFGLHGKLLLDLEHVRRVVHRDIELLDDHREGDVGLLPGKGTALVVRIRQETSSEGRTLCNIRCKPAFRSRRVATNFAGGKYRQQLVFNFLYST